MTTQSWPKEFPGAITVSDLDGIILEMNDRAAADYADRGGRALIGTNMLDCHPEPARTRVRQLLEARRKNTYTIEKNGVRKLIYQSPWFESGTCRGFVELSLEIPVEMPHFIRQ
jgi:transcriptional regulator with PAS, ATPase and Fis domain